ncbi:hypothetical protein NQ315_005025 [Exocentrus adspersus]|uniref:Uncharacterized protein n=1 Tax=Exocentrus adspersus TaxID=1586481 RepID=A0AAV8VQJ6_9CUCU|nr:hypothetical protein NQ315_005025 [Exocentrus adspersus]
MLEYDSALDQYTEVVFDEFSDSSEEEIATYKSENVRNPIVVLQKRNRISKSRSSFINYLNLARIIRKSGRLNIFLTKLPNKNLSYIRDLGNTLLTIRWRWILITLFIVNFASFFIFSVLWWMLAKHSGDFDPNSTEMCVVNTKTLTGYMLLSIETITTIGYGYRYPTEKCEGGWILLMMQVLLGIAIQGVLVSTVYVKISKPFARVSTSIFSKCAVICLRDGYTISIKKIWCGTNISLYFVEKEHTYPDSEFEIVQMTIEPHGLLIFPLEIEHIIDENSPLWTFRPLDILQSRFEIIAVAEGSSNITGQVSQNRTSYSNSDIYWGQRFRPCVDYDEIKQAYTVDYKKFKQTVQFDTPLCSAKKLNDITAKFIERKYCRELASKDYRC